MSSGYVSRRCAPTYRRYDHPIDAASPPFAHYLHVTGIPALRIRGQSTIHLDASWARDLSHHTYLGRRITVLCPVTDVDAVPSTCVPFTDARFEFVALPAPSHPLHYLASGRILRVVRRLWTQLGRADLMFAGLVEYPFPLGWFAFPLARVRRVTTYTFLESTPWRLVPFTPAPWKHRLRAKFAAACNALVVPLIDFAAITQPAYGDLLPASTPRVLTPASWFLHEELAPIADVERRATAPRSDSEPPVVLFAARLDPAKGIRQLLAALQRIDADGCGPLVVRVLGTGQLEGELQEVAQLLTTVRLERLEPLRYGPEFLRVFQDVECVVVPNLSDEQPRIVFDAASQGVPTIAFDTTGDRAVVDDSVTGALVPPGSVDGLAAALGALRRPEERARFADMGLRARASVSDYDHVAMHERRAAFIGDLVQTGSIAPGRRRRRRATRA